MSAKLSNCLTNCMLLPECHTLKTLFFCSSLSEFSTERKKKIYAFFLPIFLATSAWYLLVLRQKRQCRSFINIFRLCKISFQNSQRPLGHLTIAQHSASLAILLLPASLTSSIHLRFRATSSTTSSPSSRRRSSLSCASSSVSIKLCSVWLCSTISKATASSLLAARCSISSRSASSKSASFVRSLKFRVR